MNLLFSTFSNTKKILKSWLSHDPFTQSAAAAYYAIFSLPGLLIIFTGISAFFLEKEEVKEKVSAQLSTMLSEDATNNIYQIIYNMQVQDSSLLAVAIGVLTLLLGATGLFVQLQRSLNNIWEIEVRKSAGILRFILDRMISLGVIITVGFVLLTSLLMTTFVTFLVEWFSEQFSDMWLQAIETTNFLLSFITVTLLFTVIFKVLPDVKIVWSCAFRGGFVSACIFMIGGICPEILL